MFDTPGKLALGLLTGIVFGFLLQKGRAAKFHVIVGQFLLRDWTVVKIMVLRSSSERSASTHWLRWTWPRYT